MGSVCVSSCRCCVFVSGVHPVAILSAVFCVICSLLCAVFSWVWCEESACCFVVGHRGYLNNTQHGFRSGRSCLSALLDVYDNIMHMINNKSTVSRYDLPGFFKGF